MNRAFNPESTEDTFSYDPKKFIKSQEIIKKSENNYEHVFIRNTKTFGEIPPEKEKIFIESIDNETKTLIEENEKIKNENDSIIQSLNDLPDLNNEYEKLNQINAKLKEELNKMQQK